MPYNSRRWLLSRAPLAFVTPVLGAARTELREMLENAPIANTHEHTLSDRERREMEVDLFTILLSGYSATDLASAGLSRKRTPEVWDTKRSPAERWKALAPFWDRARNTGYVRAVEIAMRDLFGVEQITEANCEKLSERIAAGNRRGVNNWILREKCRNTFIILDDQYHPDPVMPESDLFVNARRFDRFVWLNSREDVEKLEKALGRAMGTLTEFENALEADFERNRKGSRMVTLKTTLAYQRPLLFRKTARADAEHDFDRMRRTLAAPAPEDPHTRWTQLPFRAFQDYIFHSVIRLAAAHNLPFQIHTGIQAGSNYVPNSNPAQLSNLFALYPEMKFDLFHSGYPYLSEAVVVAKMYPNVYIDLCWTHIISPSAAKRALHEYLDALASNKVMGFGGDYRYAEQTYGHCVMARENMIQVLDARVAEGYFKEDHAIAIGRRIFSENAAELFLPKNSA